MVTIASKGFTEATREEINRALNDHELIKVSVKTGSREARSEISTLIFAPAVPAELVQAIGKIILIYRPAEKPNPRLSNLLR